MTVHAGRSARASGDAQKWIIRVDDEPEIEVQAQLPEFADTNL